MDRPAVGAVEDLATLAQLDESILLNELKTRYSNDNIYTYVGDILVAVNPYKKIEIYGKDQSAKYSGVSRSAVSPHIFAIADAAFQRMRGATSSNPKDQCVLISGESGAGKTESTKLIIRQLIELCQGNTYIEQQILQCNPILEAFGNAQTVFNDNSSRFGRYIQLRFENGQVKGSKINEYLLEKSRLVAQGRREQNFHIFYYMFAGLPDEVKQTYNLGPPESYKYLSDGIGCLKTSRNVMAERFDELINAFDIVGFTDKEQDDMFTLLSGALNAGNIDLGENDNGESVLKDQGVANTVAKLLGLEPLELKGVLTSSVTFVKGQEIKRNYHLSQAIDSRDAISKAVYGRLFSWMINKVNQLLAPKDVLAKEKTQEIGILDIFGFEKFEVNSFEQICINLANEQLQFFFNKHIFMLEQEEYKKEGVDWREIKFVDNKGILELFLARPIGILSLLDEESIVPNGSDKSFVDKLTGKFADNPHYGKSSRSGSGIFTIRHYAGEVKYTVEKWLEKNRDTMPAGVMEMLQQSQNALLGVIFRGQITRTGTLALTDGAAIASRKLASGPSSKERKMTVSTQFKNSLTVLLERMTSAEPIFIRCIKPNNDKKSGLFIDDFVQAQLLYTGMLETTKIRREGFAVRPTFADFVNKFKVVARKLTMPPNSASCHEILAATKLTGWHIGKTKVFLKYWHIEKLADIMEEMGKVVVHIQRVVRGFLARRQIKRRRELAVKEAAEAKRLQDEIKSQSNKAKTVMEQKTKEDKKIPKAFFKKGGDGGPPPVIISPTAPPADIPHYATTLDDLQFGTKPKNKQVSLRWFQETQLPQLKEAPGRFAEYFHGIITRKEAERLIKHKPTGCFLIRVSESRFGYSLSFKAEDRVRHYMIDQTPSGKYVIIGEPRVHRSLNDLIEYYRKTALSNWSRTLGDPCGQEEGQCDYWDLLGDEDKHYLENNDKGPRHLAPPPPKQSAWSAFDCKDTDLNGAKARLFATREKSTIVEKAGLSGRVKLSTTRQRTMKAPNNPPN